MKLEIRPEGHENEVIKRIARKKERWRERVRNEWSGGKRRFDVSVL